VTIEVVAAAEALTIEVEDVSLTVSACEDVSAEFVPEDDSSEVIRELVCREEVVPGFAISEQPVVANRASVSSTATDEMMLLKFFDIEYLLFI